MADFLDIGAGNALNPMRLIAVVNADSSPVRRLIQDARDRGMLIDASSGKKTLSALVMDSDHIVCSAIATDELKKRLAELRSAFPTAAADARVEVES